MSNIDCNKIRDLYQRVVVLADEIADALKEAGVAQSQGSYVDSRCERIKKLARDMEVAAGCSTGD